MRAHVWIHASSAFVTIFAHVWMHASNAFVTIFAHMWMHASNALLTILAHVRIFARGANLLVERASGNSEMLNTSNRCTPDQDASHECRYASAARANTCRNMPRHVGPARTHVWSIGRGSAKALDVQSPASGNNRNKQNTNKQRRYNSTTPNRPIPNKQHKVY